MTGNATPAKGDLLGRYRLDSILGTGGMATVWLAHDERLGRTVAVKVLSETLALDDDFVKRFRREAKVAAGLSHPNLVKVFDFGAEGPRPYLVSEYIEGGTLADRLGARQKPDAEDMASGLLGALDHIHRAGVIHRDVKPANVLLDRDGRCLLTDFGVAQPRGATQLTEAGKVLGTIAYMAPEVRGGATADERSDLYSAGVLLEEAAAGGPAAANLRPLIDRLTADDPRKRPRSAREALEMIGRPGVTAPTEPLFAPTEPRDGAVATAATRALPRLPSNRLLAAGALIAALCIVGIVLASGAGDGGTGGGPGGTKTAATNEGGAATQPVATEQAPTGSTTPQPTSTTGSPSPAAPPAPAADPCAGLGPGGSAPQAPAGKGPADKELKEQEKALKEQAKACENAGG